MHFPGESPTSNLLPQVVFQARDQVLKLDRLGEKGASANITPRRFGFILGNNRGKKHDRDLA